LGEIITITKSGFTLIELLITIAVLAILSTGVLFSVVSQRMKAEDSRIKTDLHDLKIAFEDYHNDKNCYPPLDWFDSASDCGSNNLSPYLNILPCDRKTGLPYVLRTSTCDTFVLYATIKNSNDAKYSPFYDGSTLLGTYAVSSSNLDLYLFTDNPTNTYYCSKAPISKGSSGHCGTIPAGYTCTPNYSSSTCGRVGGGLFCQTVSTCNH